MGTVLLLPKHGGKHGDGSLASSRGKHGDGSVAHAGSMGTVLLLP